MADIIKLLPDHVANQIAAGEVVQRPASVVKELLENAVDANAKIIDLIVRDAGKSLIQVVDDGNGMSVADARMCFERYATSKIKTSEDLFQIHTKGFRGEALASIAAVTQLELRTKDQESEVGTRILIEGSQIKEQIPIQTSNGTAVSVKNLFYNVPARRNFLKSPQIEFRHITDEFHRVALAHPDIVFRFHHNEEMIFHFKTSSLRQRIVGIFGQKINEQLVPLSEQTEWVTIEGFIAKPAHSKKNRGEQFFFVNRRFVRSPYLNRSILDAYEGLLQVGYYPSYFVFLRLEPKHIDINIHPTKTEIKFDDESAMYAMLRASVKHALGQYQVTPALDFEKDLSWDFLPDKNQPVRSPRITVDPDYNPFTTPWNTQWTTDQEVISIKNLYEQIKESSVELDSAFGNLSTAPLFDASSADNVVRWQIYEKYIIIALKSGLILIDQHRAHQRILYERFLNTSDQEILNQELLFPVHVALSPVELNQLKTLHTDLVGMGFVVKFSQNAVSVLATPTDIRQEDIVGFIQEVLAHLTVNDKSRRESFARSIAKTGAIKRGVKLTSSEIQHLIDSLFACTDPNHSPFGWPVFITLTMDFIEKQFHQ
ncbi:MAG: DNA mismatch repair endonuclease MutL [Flavobacteriales bacterium AspAUS03]